MPTHRLSATPETVRWGTFSADYRPAVTIASGDTVEVECVSGARDVMPPGRTRLHRAARSRRDPGRRHPACARPYTYRADRDRVALIRATCWKSGSRRSGSAPTGATAGFVPLAGTLPEDFPERYLSHIPIDQARGVCTLPWGTELPLAPFFGVMGVAPPPDWGVISTVEPRAHGGNLDNKELGAGATLFLPVFVPGANFSTGDGHGVQGDGEVCINALETCLTGTFTLILHKANGREPMLRYPRAETRSHFISMGMHEDLDVAMKTALREMIAFITSRTNLSRQQAYQLCSLAADFHVTQTVNREKGVHGMLRRELLGG